MVNRRTRLLAVVLILVLSALRLIHLGADTPLNLATTSAGAYVDEGYKTLGGRNLLLHGTRDADPDRHRPELRSPLSDWLFFLAFGTFGLTLGTARTVTILWFLLFLVGFAYATIKDYEPALFLLGMGLLGLLHTLFFFSRLAMFVVALTTCLYWLLFLIRRWGFDRPLRAAVAFLVAVLLTTFAIKITAPLYFLPVLFGLTLASLVKRNTKPALILTAGLPALAGVAALILLTRDIWRHFLDLDGVRILSNTLLSPLNQSQPLWVFLGVVCAFHILLTTPRTFLACPYRASLMCIVLSGPVLLAFFAYSPLRYYVPLAPAYVLLPLEWFHLRAWQWPLSTRPRWLTAMLCLPPLVWAVFSFGQAVNLYVLASLPIPLGNEPGLGDDAMFYAATPLAIFVAILLWVYRGRLLTPRSSLVTVCLVAALGLGQDLRMIAGFWVSPSYRAREIRQAIEAAAPAGGVLAGDWAPFFTIGTRLEPLRMFNYSKPEGISEAQERLLSAHPELFLWNEMRSSRPQRGKPRWLIKVTPGVSLGRPLFESTYAGSKVIVYPITYDRHPGTAGLAAARPGGSAAPGEPLRRHHYVTAASR